MTDHGNNVAGAELLAFIERLERTEADIRELQEHKKETYAEAKGRGYDVKVLKQLLARRRRDKDQLAEEEAMLDMYESAIMMARSRRDSSDPLDD